MPVRLVAFLLLAALLAACSDDEPREPPGRTSLSPESTAAPGDGGALDAVDGSVVLTGADEDSFVDSLVLDPDGEPVVLVSATGNDDRRLLRPTATQGWGMLRESDLGAGVQLGGLVAATADDVLAAGVQDGRLTLFRIATDGSITSVPVPGAPEGLEYGSGLLAPDGARLYLVFHTDGGPTTVAAADPATGAMSTSVPSPPGRFVGFAGSDLVFLDTGTVREQHAEITRLTADLQPAGSVEVDESYVRSAGGVDGTAYATVLSPDERSSLAEVSLLAMPPGATAAETVWSVPDAYLLSELGAPVVDADGAWAYLPSAQITPGESTLVERITPVDLSTGEPAGSVRLCIGYQFGGIAFAPGGGSAVVAVRCDDSDVPTLFTLR
jgi:hypothetical protein